MNFIDTAEGYGDGRSESIIGDALEGMRDKAIIASKVHYNGGTYRRDKLVEACEASLKRLRTDYLDLYQLHWPVFDDESQENVAAVLQKLKDDGKIRHFGVCNFGVEQLGDFLNYTTPVSNQLPYSIIWRAIEYGVTDLTIKAGMGILAYSSLHSGVLSGRYNTADEIPAERVAKNIFASEQRQQLAMEAIESIRKTSSSYGVSMPELVVGWVLSRPGITSVLLGARTEAQVRQNLEFGDKPLPTGALDSLTRSTEALKADIGDHADMFQNPSRMR